MERYRVNYRLLVGLAVGFVVVTGLLYWRWVTVMDENAVMFLKKADAAEEEDDLREAYQDMKHYIDIRKDDLDARVRLANFALDVFYKHIKLGDLGDKEYLNARGTTEEALRRAPERDELRERLVQLLLDVRSHEAINHLDVLIEKDPKNSELLAKRLDALFVARDFVNAIDYGYQLISYDRLTDEFDATKATASDQPSAYSHMAELLLSREKKDKLARRVIDQMVEVNPESVEAQRLCAKYLMRIGEDEQAQESIDRALALDPGDPESLQIASSLALGREEYETARSLLEEGLKQHPDEIAFYELLARADYNDKQLDSAIETLDQGIERFPGIEGFNLRMLKMEVLFSQEEIAGVEKELKGLEAIRDKNKASAIDFQAVIDFQHARIKYIQNRWLEAEEDLSRVIPILRESPATRNYELLGGLILAQCYERLGKYDLALKTLNQLLDVNSGFKPALALKQRIARRLDRDTAPSNNQLDQMVDEELAKPARFQRWDSIDKAIDEFVVSAGLSEAHHKIIQAKILTRRKLYDQATEIAKEAYELEPDDQAIVYTAIALVQQNPDGGNEQALEMFRQAEGRFEDSVQWRLVHAQLLIAQHLNRDQGDLPEQLEALTEGIEDWEPEQQAQLWSSIGNQFQRLGMPEEARRCLLKASELAPTDLPTRMQLFDLAFTQRDDQAMQEAQKKILELVKNKDDGSYLLTEIRRQIMAYATHKISKEEVKQARNLLNKALAERPDWHEIHFVAGQMAYLLDQDGETALKEFERASELGPSSLPMIALQVRLLAERGRFQEALAKMREIPKVARTNVLGELEAIILLNNGENEEAFEAAQKQAERNEQNPLLQVWYASIAEKLEKNRPAELAYRKAIALNPFEDRYWMQLIAFYVKTQQIPKVEDTFREAQLQLPAEQLPLLMGKYYELQGRWMEAEDLYLAAYADRLGDTKAVREIARFYLSWSQRDPSKTKKAAPYLNRILKQVYEGDVAVDNEDAVWARQQSAKLLAASKDYQQIRKAIRLLTVKNADGQLLESDELLKAEILATLRDPISVMEAIDSLTAIQEKHNLSLEDSLSLINLLHAAGNEEECKNKLDEALRLYGSDPKVWATYVSILLDRGELNLAEQRLIRLVENLPDSPVTIRLQARFAAKRGRMNEVAKHIRRLLPENLRLADEEQLNDIRSAATLAAELGNYPVARELLAFYVKRRPEQSLLLAQYLARYDDTDNAMRVLQQMFNLNVDATLDICMSMLQNRRKEFGDKYDQAIDEMVSKALRDDPESIQRQLIHAQLLELQQKYEESAAIYEKIVKHRDTPKTLRAMAMNNVSFIWALRKQRLDDAARYINEAAEVLGPISDILDTRAVVSIAQGKYDAAVSDMQLSLQVESTALKYFHLAQAQLLAGNQEAALQAWNEAEDMGLSDDTFTKLEIDIYREIAKKIESLGD